MKKDNLLNCQNYLSENYICNSEKGHILEAKENILKQKSLAVNI